MRIYLKPHRGPKKNLLKSLATIAAIAGISAVLYSFLHGGLSAGSAGPIDVTFRPVPLNSEDPAQKTVGALTYLAGFELSSSDQRFGGFSGLLAEADGRFVAVSDAGIWLTGDLQGAGPFALIPMAENVRNATKHLFDAEALVRSDDGYLVTTERNHRLLSVAKPGAAPVPRPETALMQGWGLSSNGGIEAVTRLDDGTLLMFAERGQNIQGLLPVWLVDTDRTVFNLKFKPPHNFAPTDAATLPNGDILLLLRRFNSEAVAAKLLRVRARDIKPGAVIRGEDLMTLAPPLSVDNMEALDTLLLEDGSQLVILLSDDNFNWFQRTLLMLFRLDN